MKVFFLYFRRKWELENIYLTNHDVDGFRLWEFNDSSSDVEEVDSIRVGTFNFFNKHSTCLISVSSDLIKSFLPSSRCSASLWRTSPTNERRILDDDGFFVGDVGSFVRLCVNGYEWEERVSWDNLFLDFISREILLLLLFLMKLFILLSLIFSLLLSSLLLLMLFLFLVLLLLLLLVMLFLCFSLSLSFASWDFAFGDVIILESPSPLWNSANWNKKELQCNYKLKNSP